MPAALPDLVPHGAQNDRDVGEAAAAGRDADAHTGRNPAVQRGELAGHRRINVTDVGRVEMLPDPIHRGQWRFNVQVRDMIEQGRCCHRCSSRLPARSLIHGVSLINTVASDYSRAWG